MTVHLLDPSMPPAMFLLVSATVSSLYKVVGVTRVRKELKILMLRIPLDAVNVRLRLFYYRKYLYS